MKSHSNRRRNKGIREKTFPKKKLRLYFDEDFPKEVESYFVNCPQLKKKLAATSARICGHLGRTDEFHYKFCQSRGYVLVTCDTDFNNDHVYPFTSDGRPIPGIIIIRPTQVLPVASVFSRLVFFYFKNAAFARAFT